MSNARQRRGSKFVGQYVIIGHYCMLRSRMFKTQRHIADVSDMSQE